MPGCRGIRKETDVIASVRLSERSVGLGEFHAEGVETPRRRPSTRSSRSASSDCVEHVGVTCTKQ